MLEFVFKLRLLHGTCHLVALQRLLGKVLTKAIFSRFFLQFSPDLRLLRGARLCIALVDYSQDYGYTVLCILILYPSSVVVGQFPAMAEDKTGFSSRLR